jgi:ABC-type multidrug transport system fused ATPase/permease subunit
MSMNRIQLPPTIANDSDSKLAQLCREPDWHAAGTILASDAFIRDGRVWSYVNLVRKEIHFDRILKDGTFSGGERRLIEIAASLFNSNHKVNLWRAFAMLDSHSTEIAIRAIRAYTQNETQRRDGHRKANSLA